MRLRRVIAPIVLALVWQLALLPQAVAQGERLRSVRVTSSPAGASVHLNNPTSPPLGATPIRRARVPEGEQTFIFRMKGYEELRVVQQIERRGNSVDVTLQPAALLDVQAGDEASHGAQLDVGGVVMGRVPQQLELPPGRHQVRVSREGYEPVEQWIEVNRGDTHLWSVELGPPNYGSILVSADVDGAEVWFQGVLYGQAPLVLEEVAVGEQEVEVRAPERRPYVTTVTVAPGEQATVSARIRLGVGELQVIGNVDGAEVRLDGEPIGRLPLRQSDVAVGQHILEVMARGYDPLHETINIEGGMRRVIGVRLEPSLDGGAMVRRGSVVVTSDAPEAHVSVNDSELGPAPATLADVSAGTYAIEVTADGHQPYRTRCTVAEGESCSRDAVLFQTDARLRLTSTVGGAELLIDGRPVGPLPYDGGLPQGPTELSVRAAGYLPWNETVRAEGETELVLEAELRRQPRPVGGLLLHSAFTVPRSSMALDGSLGWPHFLEARFTAGILPMIDVGGAVRTFGRLTEVEARGRYSFEPFDYLVIGGTARLGGGGGPRGVSTFFLILEANATIHWQRRYSATLIQGLDLYSDGYPYSETDADVPAAATGRQNTFAYRLGLALDAVLGKGVSVWGTIEWTAVPTQLRRVLGDIIGLNNESARVAVRLGLGFEF